MKKLKSSSVFSTLKKFAPYLLVTTIVIFFYLYIRNIDFSNLNLADANYNYLVIALMFSLGFRYWGVVVWSTILSALGAKKLPEFHLLAVTYAKSWMARYIPGTVTWIASKVYIAKSVGISKGRLTVSSLVEAGVQISALAAVSLLILALDPRVSEISTALRIIALGIGVLSILVLIPSVFNRLMVFGLGLLKKDARQLEAQTNKETIVKSYVLYTIGAFISGASYYFISKSLVPSIGFSDFLYITATFNLAGVLGMVTPFVPSGLGVRDGVQLLLLSVIFPTDIALVLTIFSRLWTAVVDVLFLGITFSINKLSKGDSI